MATMEEIKAYTPYTLADMAGCFSPDNPESEGVEFLAGVLQAVVERMESGDITPGDTHDNDHEIADSAVPVYTHAKWKTFIDLGAYQEEPEAGEWPTNLDDAASVAMYQIARRLVGVLAADLDEPDDEPDEDEYETPLTLADRDLS